MSNINNKITIGFKQLYTTIIFSSIVLLIAFISPLLGGSPAEPGLGFFLWGIAPMLTALIMRTLKNDWKESGFKPYFRKNIKWYLLSILLFPLTMFISVIVGGITSSSVLSGFLLSDFLKTFLISTPVFLIFSIFEEIGWRGYLVPKIIEAKLNPFIGYAIIAVVWFAWHFPYVSELTWIYTSEALISFIPRFLICLFSLSVLYGEIRIITGSIWPVVLMHGVMNSIGHPLTATYLTVEPGKHIIGSLGDGIVTIVITLILGIILYRYRTRMLNIEHIN